MTSILGSMYPVAVVSRLTVTNPLDEIDTVPFWPTVDPSLFVAANKQLPLGFTRRRPFSHQGPPGPDATLLSSHTPTRLLIE